MNLRKRVCIFQLLALTLTAGALETVWAFTESERLAQSLETEAIGLLHEDNYADAIKIYDKLIELYPDNEYYASRRSMAKGDMEYMDYEKKQLRELNKTIELDPSNPQHYIERYHILMRMGVTLHDKIRIFSEALRDANKAIEMEPANPNLYAERASVWFWVSGKHKEDETSYAKSILDLEKAVSIENPKINEGDDFVSGCYHEKLGHTYHSAAEFYQKQGNRKRREELCRKVRPALNLAVKHKGRLHVDESENASLCDE